MLPGSKIVRYRTVHDQGTSIGYIKRCKFRKDLHLVIYNLYFSFSSKLTTLVLFKFSRQDLHNNVVNGRCGV